MRLKLLACKALYRESAYLTARCENFVDATFLRQGLHDTPKLLQEAVQREIDKIDAGDDMYSYKSHYSKREFDAILLGYGLCSNGVVGVSSQKYPLVIPRAHDCIALFWGSRERYDTYFAQHGGTFWYNASWIENASTPSEETEREMLDVYTERYGEENAQFLLEAELTENYDRCAYITWPELSFPEYEAYTRRAAQFKGWEFDLVQGDSSWMRDFFDGNWDAERFLVVQPGEVVAADYDDPHGIICARCAHQSGAKAD